MATNKQLTVHNASVTTMTVEVKALTIGTRQVTQGIFRQLIEEPIIAEDGTLNGIPWGHVTWHPDKCDRKPEHWHIVWQNGTELRRSTVTTIPSFDPDPDGYRRSATFQSEEADACLSGAVREWLQGRFEKMPLAMQRGLSSGSPSSDPVSWSTKHGFVANAYPSDVALTAARARLAAEVAVKELKSIENVATAYANEHAEWQKNALERARGEVEAKNAALDEAEAQLGAELGDRSYRDLVAAFHAATQAEAERRQRHRDVRTQLSELPQLFIGG